MTIAVPLTNAHEFSVHFGAAAKVGLFALDAAGRRLVRFDVVEPPDRLPCGWADWLGVQGVRVLLAGAISEGARQRLAAAGIDVIAGVRADEPILLVQSWLAGTLSTGPNGCVTALFGARASAWPTPVPPPEASFTACCCLRGLTRARDEAALAHR